MAKDINKIGRLLLIMHEYVKDNTVMHTALDSKPVLIMGRNKYNRDSVTPGLCSVARQLVYEGVYNDVEYQLVKDYIMIHKPVYVKQKGYESPFGWPIMVAEPRLQWLKEQVHANTK